jgi:hypothetical protein
MADLFAGMSQQFRTYAPDKARAPRKPTVEGVRYAGGICNAACMYAIGEDCDCPCLGRNHRAGFRCDNVAPPPTATLL